LHFARIQKDTVFHEAYRSDILDGVMTLTAQAEKLTADWKDDQLYKPATEEHYTQKTWTFIPYYAWANRSEGEMLVWVHQK